MFPCQGKCRRFESDYPLQNSTKVHMQFQAIESLFPTAVGFYRDEEKPNNSELTFINNLPQRANQFNRTSADSYLFKQKKLQRIHKTCLEAAQDYFNRIFAPKTACELYVTQAWANYTTLNESHHKHAHPNSIISGVYYVDARAESDRIKFFKPGTYRGYEFVTENFNAWNSDSWWLPVETGVIVCFPSSFEHMVDVVSGDYTRVSIAFNTFFRGTVGSDLNLTELKL